MIAISKLEQTKNKFTVRGYVVKPPEENHYEGTMEKGKNAGKTYRIVNIDVKTSHNNIVRVGLFANEKDFVYPHNPQTKHTEKIPFEERHSPPEGYRVFGTNVNITKRTTMDEYDAVPHILENIYQGDEVFVSGEIQWRNFKSKNTNEMIVVPNFQIKSISKNEGKLDFDDENFEEISSFSQEIVFVDCFGNQNKDKLIVNAHVIDFAGNFLTPQFVINLTNNNMNKLAKVFSKFNFGDFVNVEGLIVRRVEEAEAEDEDDDWPGEKPAGMRTGKNFINEMAITYADRSTYEKKKYSEDDFVITEGEVAQESNPFDEDSPFEEGDDGDLPF